MFSAAWESAIFICMRMQNLSENWRDKRALHLKFCFWRYVSRRIKDTVERTCNVLEARRTWTCGNEGVNGYDGNQSSYENNKHFLRHLEKRSPSSLFEFGLEPKHPDDRKAVRKDNGSRNVCNFQRKFTAADNYSGPKSSDKEDFRERVHRRHHCKLQRNVVDALTWVS